MSGAIAMAGAAGTVETAETFRKGHLSGFKQYEDLGWTKITSRTLEISR
jgi:hypothetical protein